MCEKDKTNKVYAKENNILQLCLFNFSKKRTKKTATKWVDENGTECELVCHCDRGVPGSFEMDVYTATMRLWIEQDMPEDGVEVTYIGIARELGLTSERGFVTDIKNALKRLGLARYEFEQCFIDGKKRGKKVFVQFSLYDTTCLFEKEENKSTHGVSKLYFPKEVRENLKAKYFQFLDMDVYNSLPSGLPRRLYEYLVKRKRHQIKGVFTISENIVCRWLPINIKNTTRRRETLEKAAKELVKIKFLKSYKFDKKNELCLFTYAKSKVKIPALAELVAQPQQIAEAKDDSQFCEFTQWLDSIKGFNKARQKEILCLDQQTTLAIYPAIRKHYEQSNSELGPAWLYKALKERWTFPEKKEKTKPLTKEERQVKEAFANWPADKQQRFKLEVGEFIKLNTELDDERIDNIVNSDGIYGTWGQLLLDKFS